MSDPTPESTPSPYGPAAVTAPTPADSTTAVPPTAEPAWVERGRRILRVLALVTGLLAVVVTITVIVLAVLGMGTADNDLSGITETLTYSLIFGAPVLGVIAINLLVWRALLRPLGRMATAGRVGLIALMLLVLGLGSVALVALFLLGGFFAGALIGAGSGF